jgi:cyclase
MTLRTLLMPLLLVTASLGHAATPDWDAVEIKTTELGDGMYMLQGRGGNLGVSVGEDGIFLIDNDYAQLAPKIQAALKELSDSSVEYLANTHWHGDHAGGNEAFHAHGSRIVAHDNVRVRMGAEGPNQSPDTALPELTYSDNATLHFNGNEIRMLHVKNAHTDGDSVVHFTNQNIVHTGDVMFNGLFPFIDLASGGSSAGYVDGLKFILNLTDENTRVIPGHGPLANRGDLVTSIAMLQEARAAVRALVEAGKSLEETKAATPLAKFDADYSWAFIDADVFTTILYTDLSR